MLISLEVCSCAPMARGTSLLNKHGIVVISSLSILLRTFRDRPTFRSFSDFMEANLDLVSEAKGIYSTF